MDTVKRRSLRRAPALDYDGVTCKARYWRSPLSCQDDLQRPAVAISCRTVTTLVTRRNAKVEDSALLGRAEMSSQAVTL